MGRGGKCYGENRVQPQVPQVSAEECCEVGGQLSLEVKKGQCLIFSRISQEMFI